MHMCGDAHTGKASQGGKEMKKAPFLIIILCLLSGSEEVLIAGTVITGICVVLQQIIDN